MDRVDQGDDILHRRLRQDPVAQVEDMPRPPGRPGEDASRTVSSELLPASTNTI